jgi:hypothetical protein
MYKTALNGRILSRRPRHYQSCSTIEEEEKDVQHVTTEMQVLHCGILISCGLYSYAVRSSLYSKGSEKEQ